MNNKKAPKIYSLLFCCLFAVIIFVTTASISSAASFTYTPMEKIPGFENQTNGDFYTYITLVYNFGIWAVGIAALLMISIGGFMYVTSAGNNSSMEKAKGVITDALIGLILALTSYLLLYIINPDLVKIKALSQLGTGGGTSAGTSTTPGATTPTGPLAKGCENYAATFDSVSGGDKNLKCLLIGIANQESSCNPSLMSKKGACGLMQMVPATAGTSCDELKNNPDKSIQLAGKLLNNARSTLNTYSQFNIGSSNQQNGTTVTYGSNTYDTGNDDLLAAYNAGSGKVATTPGKEGPFITSDDCKNPITPNWQCHINPGGFNETQNYVIRVQTYQKQCLAKN